MNSGTKLTSEQQAQLARDYAIGMTMRQILSRHHVSCKKAHHVIISQGVTIRPGGKIAAPNEETMPKTRAEQTLEQHIRGASEAGVSYGEYMTMLEAENIKK